MATRPRCPLVGRLADGWNIAYVSPEDFAQKLAIVHDHAAAPEKIVTGVNVGLVFADHDPDEELEPPLRRLLVVFVKEGTLYGSVDQIVEKIGRYQEAGADWINIGVRYPFDLAALERFVTEVVPQT